VPVDSAKPPFETLVLPEMDAAYSFARWMTGNPTDAQDVVQDAMVRMLRYIDTYRGGNARAWVLRIVRNTALTWLQTNRRPGHVSLDEDADRSSGVDALLVSHGNDGGDPAAIELRRSEIEALHRAIRDLPLEQREVVLLRDVEGLSYREIATILEVPPGTVMSRLARARDVLEQRLRGPNEARHDA
jgi:RNA polymerase sigma factor (sigma-70 family)